MNGKRQVTEEKAAFAFLSEHRPNANQAIKHQLNFGFIHFLMTGFQTVSSSITFFNI
jgi:hypothetical protein